MTEVWFIRHGESLSNAGHIVEKTAIVPLTERGHQQAKTVSTALIAAPDIVVVTPYLRTQQTAIPTLERFPSARREIWPLQEFGCLSHANYANTTAMQRSPLVKTYWERRDPDYVDGEGAESFNAMTARIKDALNRLQSTPEDFIAVFTHGRIMHTLRFLLEYPELPANEMMRAIQEYVLHTEIGNCSIIRTTVDTCSVRLNEEDRAAFYDGLPTAYKKTA